MEELRLDFPRTEDKGYKSTINISPFLSNPVSAGLCSYNELKNSSLYDVYIMNEILAVRNYNEMKSMEVKK